MTSQQVIYVVAGTAGVLCIAAWAMWILVPAWTAHSRVWQRLLAAILSVYVLAAFVLVGAAILWYWDEL